MRSFLRVQKIQRRTNLRLAAYDERVPGCYTFCPRHKIVASRESSDMEGCVQYSDALHLHTSDELPETNFALEGRMSRTAAIED